MTTRKDESLANLALMEKKGYKHFSGILVDEKGKGHVVIDECFSPTVFKTAESARIDNDRRKRTVSPYYPNTSVLMATFSRLKKMVNEKGLVIDIFTGFSRESCKN